MSEEVKNTLTANQATVLEILRETGAKMLSEDVAAARPDAFANGAKSVSAVMTQLVKRELVNKEKVSVTRKNAEGADVTKELTCYWISDAGTDFAYEIVKAK